MPPADTQSPVEIGEDPTPPQVFTLEVDAGCELTALSQRFQSMKAAGDLEDDPIKVGERFRITTTSAKADTMRDVACVTDVVRGWQEIRGESVPRPLPQEMNDGRQVVLEGLERPLATEDTGSISGTVTSEATGSPIPGILLCIYSYVPEWGGYDGICQDVTDSNGHYTIDALLPGDYRVGFEDASTGNYILEYYDDAPYLETATDISVIGGSIISGIDAALATAAHITGTVTADDGGAPLQDIYVEAYRFNGSDWDYVNDGYTDSSGYYDVGGLPAGTYRLGFFDWDNGTYVDEYYDNVPDLVNAADIAVATGGTVTGIDAALAVAGHITGTVTDETTGLPIEGISVYAYVFDGAEWVFSGSVTSTDAAGQYDLNGLNVGSYVVWFWDWDSVYLQEKFDNAPDFENATEVNVAIGSTVTGIDAALVMAAHITGTVTAEAGGAPLQDIEVRAYRFDGSSWGSVGNSYTDENGLYELGGLTAGTYRLRFRDLSGNYVTEYYNDAPDLNSATDIVVAAGATATGKNAALATAGHITGMVTADDGGAPLPDIYVEAYRFNGSDWDYVSYGYTDSSGYYDVGGLPAGTYRLGFFDWDNATYVTEYFNNAPELDGATDIVVAAGATAAGKNAALATAAHITGTVTAELGGAPLPDVDVVAYAFDGFDWVEVGYGYTDDNGFYDIGGLPSGNYRVRFWDYAGGYGFEFYDDVSDLPGATDILVTAGSTVNGIDAALAVAGRISGTVTAVSSSLPLFDITVWLYRYIDSEWVFLIGVPTDFDGQYEFNGLAPGTYRVEFYDWTEVYAKEVYDNASSLSEGTDIPVEVAALVAGIDAALSVPVPPINDDFDAALDASPLPYQDDRDVLAATTALDDPDLTCGPADQGYGSVWYTVTPGADSFLTADTSGSTYDTVLAVWEGSRGSLSAVTCDDDSGDGLQSRVEDVILSGGTTYFIEVAGYGSTLGQLVLSLDLVAASPFTACVSNTGNDATIAVPAAVTMLGGFTLEAGDEFALFTPYGSVCAGHGVWTGGSLGITAWGDDTQTPATDGFVAGQEMVWALWDASANERYDDLLVTYSLGDGIYTSNSFHAVGSIDVNPLVTHDIALSSTWNLISSYVEPEDPALETVLAGIVGDMVLLKNGIGQVYWPAYGINQLGDWDVRRGYQVYMNNPAMLSITGHAVDPAATPIPLNAGWNMAAYLRSTAMPIDQALTSISAELYLAKNGAGQVYWPAFGINNISSMQPGQAYQLYMNSAGTLMYPGN